MASEEPVHKQVWFWPVMISIFTVVFSVTAMALALRGTTVAAVRQELFPPGHPPAYYDHYEEPLRRYDF